MKRLLHPLVFLLAVVIVFQEWLWDELTRLARHLSSLPMVKAMEQRLRRLAPWPSLAVLLLPAVLLFPCKLAALWAMGHHRPVLGLGVLIAAKVIGTSVAAYLFDIVRDSARQLAWFDRFYQMAIGALARTKAWLVRQPSYLAARALAARLRRLAMRGILKLTSRSRLRRKLQAAKVLACAMPPTTSRRSPEPIFTVSEQQLSVPSANDGDEPDVWALWPDGSMCAVGIDLCRALRQPGGKASDYRLVHVIVFDRQGVPMEWVARQPPTVPPVSFSRAARGGRRR